MKFLENCWQVEYADYGERLEFQTMGDMCCAKRALGLVSMAQLNSHRDS